MNLFYEINDSCYISQLYFCSKDFQLTYERGTNGPIPMFYRNSLSDRVPAKFFLDKLKTFESQDKKLHDSIITHIQNLEKVSIHPSPVSLGAGAGAGVAELSFTTVSNFGPNLDLLTLFKEALPLPGPICRMVIHYAEPELFAQKCWDELVQSKKVCGRIFQSDEERILNEDYTKMLLNFAMQACLAAEIDYTKPINFEQFFKIMQISQWKLDKDLSFRLFHILVLMSEKKREIDFNIIALLFITLGSPQADPNKQDPNIEILKIRDFIRCAFYLVEPRGFDPANARPRKFFEKSTFFSFIDCAKKITDEETEQQMEQTRADEREKEARRYQPRLKLRPRIAIEPRIYSFIDGGITLNQGSATIRARNIMVTDNDPKTSKIRHWTLFHMGDYYLTFSKNVSLNSGYSKSGYSHNLASSLNSILTTVREG